MNGYFFLYEEKQNSQNIVEYMEGVGLWDTFNAAGFICRNHHEAFDMLRDRTEWRPPRPQNQRNIFSTPRLCMCDKDSCCKPLVFDFWLWSLLCHVFACLVMILAGRFTSSPPLWFLLNVPKIWEAVNLAFFYWATIRQPFIRGWLYLVTFSLHYIVMDQ